MKDTILTALNLHASPYVETLRYHFESEAVIPNFVASEHPMFLQTYPIRDDLHILQVAAMSL